MRHINRLTALAVLLCCAPGCADENTSVAPRLGVEGASCDKTSDCEAPLQCFTNVCTGEESNSGSIFEASDLGMSPDVVFGPRSPANSDTAAGPGSDTSDENNATTDSGPTEPPEPDVPSPSPDPDTGPSTGGEPNPISDCTDLGVASEWTGSFTGQVDYSIALDLGVPQQDTIPVAGSLSFEIQCIDLKLMVFGDMDGLAMNEYPFQLKLVGSFDPETGELDATINEGSVTIMIVDVLFEGTFTGLLDNADEMTGEWDGYSTGTVPEGIPGTATGTGTWTASPK